MKLEWAKEEPNKCCGSEKRDGSRKFESKALYQIQCYFIKTINIMLICVAVRMIFSIVF